MFQTYRSISKPLDKQDSVSDESKNKKVNLLTPFIKPQYLPIQQYLNRKMLIHNKLNYSNSSLLVYHYLESSCIFLKHLQSLFTGILQFTDLNAFSQNLSTPLVNSAEI